MTNNQYEVKQLSINTGTTDYDVRTNNTDLRSLFGMAGYVSIYSTHAISVKIDSDSNQALPIRATTEFKIGRYDLPISNVSNLFITNASGNTATVTIILAGNRLGLTSI